MHAHLLHVDDLLRGSRPGLERTDAQRALARLAAYAVLFGLFYGSVMGSFGGWRGDRLRQMAYSAAKVPLLLLVTFAISLPSFFVLNTLLGLRTDFGEAVRALLAAQAVLAVVLAALAPLTAFWYATSTDYDAAIVFNGCMFAVATGGAQGALRRSYRPLIRRHARHRRLLQTWLVIYWFVAIQMAWVLRPFVGAVHAPARFFREGAWGNAYVVVAEVVWELLSR